MDGEGRARVYAAAIAETIFGIAIRGDRDFDSEIF